MRNVMINAAVAQMVVDSFANLATVAVVVIKRGLTQALQLQHLGKLEPSYLTEPTGSYPTMRWHGSTMHAGSTSGRCRIRRGRWECRREG